MKLKEHGTSTSEIEVLNISNHGIWLYLNSKEYFLSYEQFPWFKEARVKEIYNVQLHHENHLYWPDLDIDLHVKSIENPEKCPKIYKQK